MLVVRQSDLHVAAAVIFGTVQLHATVPADERNKQWIGLDSRRVDSHTLKYTPRDGQAAAVVGEECRQGETVRLRAYKSLQVRGRHSHNVPVDDCRIDRQQLRHHAQLRAHRGHVHLTHGHVRRHQGQVALQQGLHFD